MLPIILRATVTYLREQAATRQAQLAAEADQKIEPGVESPGQTPTPHEPGKGAVISGGFAILSSVLGAVIKLIAKLLECLLGISGWIATRLVKQPKGVLLVGAIVGLVLPAFLFGYSRARVKAVETIRSVDRIVEKRVEVPTVVERVVEKRVEVPTVVERIVEKFIEHPQEKPNAICPGCTTLYAIPMGDRDGRMFCKNCKRNSDVEAALKAWLMNSKCWTSYPIAQKPEPHAKVYREVLTPLYGQGVDRCMRCYQAMKVPTAGGTVQCPSCDWIMHIEPPEPPKKAPARRRGGAEDIFKVMPFRVQ